MIGKMILKMSFVPVYLITIPYATTKVVITVRIYFEPKFVDIWMWYGWVYLEYI